MVSGVAMAYLATSSQEMSKLTCLSVWVFEDGLDDLEVIGRPLRGQGRRWLHGTHDPTKAHMGPDDGTSSGVA